MFNKRINNKMKVLEKRISKLEKKIESISSEILELKNPPKFKAGDKVYIQEVRKGIIVNKPEITVYSPYEFSWEYDVMNLENNQIENFEEQDLIFCLEE